MHLLPYYIDEEESKTQYYSVDIKIDVSYDLRNDWWRKFSTFKGLNLKAIPHEYKEGKVGELTSQPLLNYLVALYHIENNDKPIDTGLQNNGNLNIVYEHLIKRVYQRQWGEGSNPTHQANRDLTEVEFQKVLEIVAEAAWESSGRTATENEIVKKFDTDNNSKRLLQKFQSYRDATSEGRLTNLLTAFYFKKTGLDNHGNNTFEFTHKTFGEYLVAKRILRFIKKLRSQLLPDEDGEVASTEHLELVKWVKLVGHSQMDEYLFEFIKDEIELEHRNNTKALYEIHDLILGLFNYVLHYDLPMEDCKLKNFKEQKRQAKNAKDTLLAILGCISRITTTPTQLNFKDSLNFGNLLNEIRGHRGNGSQPISFRNLTYLIIENQNLANQDFYRCCFDNSKFINVDLTLSNILKSSIQYASLLNVNMTLSQARSVNWFFSRFSGNTFDKSNMKYSNFSFCKFDRTKILDSNFNECDFETVEISNSQLVRLSLIKTIFTEVSITGSRIINTNLSSLQSENIIMVNVDKLRVPY